MDPACTASTTSSCVTRGTLGGSVVGSKKARIGARAQGKTTVSIPIVPGRCRVLSGGAIRPSSLGRVQQKPQRSSEIRARDEQHESAEGVGRGERRSSMIEARIERGIELPLFRRQVTFPDIAVRFCFCSAVRNHFSFLVWNRPSDAHLCRYVRRLCGLQSPPLILYFGLHSIRFISVSF